MSVMVMHDRKLPTHLSKSTYFSNYFFITWQIKPKLARCLCLHNFLQGKVLCISTHWQIFIDFITAVVLTRSLIETEMMFKFLFGRFCGIFRHSEIMSFRSLGFFLSSCYSAILPFQPLTLPMSAKSRLSEGICTYTVYAYSK